MDSDQHIRNQGNLPETVSTRSSQFPNQVENYSKSMRYSNSTANRNKEDVNIRKIFRQLDPKIDSIISKAKNDVNSQSIDKNLYRKGVAEILLGLGGNNSIVAPKKEDLKVHKVPSEISTNEAKGSVLQPLNDPENCESREKTANSNVTAVKISEMPGVIKIKNTTESESKNLEDNSAKKDFRANNNFQNPSESFKPDNFRGNMMVTSFSPYEAFKNKGKFRYNPQKSIDESSGIKSFLDNLKRRPPKEETKTPSIILKVGKESTTRNQSKPPIKRITYIDNYQDERSEKKYLDEFLLKSTKLNKSIREDASEIKTKPLEQTRHYQKDSEPNLNTTSKELDPKDAHIMETYQVEQDEEDEETDVINIDGTYNYFRPVTQSASLANLDSKLPRNLSGYLIKDMPRENEKSRKQNQIEERKNNDFMNSFSSRLLRESAVFKNLDKFKSTKINKIYPKQPIPKANESRGGIIDFSAKQSYYRLNPDLNLKKASTMKRYEYTTIINRNKQSHLRDLYRFADPKAFESIIKIQRWWRLIFINKTTNAVIFIQKVFRGYIVRYRLKEYSSIFYEIGDKFSMLENLMNRRTMAYTWNVIYNYEKPSILICNSEINNFSIGCKRKQNDSSSIYLNNSQSFNLLAKVNSDNDEIDDHKSHRTNQFDIKPEKQHEILFERRFQIIPQKEVDIKPEKQDEILFERRFEIIPQKEVEIKPEKQDEIKPKRQDQIESEKHEDEIKPEKQEDIKPEKQDQIESEKHEDEIKPEKQEDIKPEKQEEIKPEKQEEIKPEKQDEIIPEKQDEIKPEKQDEIKLEKQEEIKTESQDDIKPESQDYVKPEKQDEIKLEKQEDIKPQKQDEIKLEKQEEIKLEKQEEIKPEKQGKIQFGIQDDLQKKTKINEKNEITIVHKSLELTKSKIQAKNISVSGICIEKKIYVHSKFVEFKVKKIKKAYSNYVRFFKNKKKEIEKEIVEEILPNENIQEDDVDQHSSLSVKQIPQLRIMKKAILPSTIFIEKICRSRLVDYYLKKIQRVYSENLPRLKRRKSQRQLAKYIIDDIIHEEKEEDSEEEIKLTHVHTINKRLALSLVSGLVIEKKIRSTFIEDNVKKIQKAFSIHKDKETLENNKGFTQIEISKSVDFEFINYKDKEIAKVKSDEIQKDEVGISKIKNIQKHSKAYLTDSRNTRKIESAEVPKIIEQEIKHEETEPEIKEDIEREPEIKEEKAVEFKQPEIKEDREREPEIKEEREIKPEINKENEVDSKYHEIYCDIEREPRIKEDRDREPEIIKEKEDESNYPEIKNYKQVYINNHEIIAEKETEFKEEKIAKEEDPEIAREKEIQSEKLKFSPEKEIKIIGPESTEEKQPFAKVLEISEDIEKKLNDMEVLEENEPEIKNLNSKDETDIKLNESKLTKEEYLIINEPKSKENEIDLNSTELIEEKQPHIIQENSDNLENPKAIEEKNQELIKDEVPAVIEQIQFTNEPSVNKFCEVKVKEPLEVEEKEPKVEDTLVTKENEPIEDEQEIKLEIQEIKEPDATELKNEIIKEQKEIVKEDKLKVNEPELIESKEIKVKEPKDTEESKPKVKDCEVIENNEPEVIQDVKSTIFKEKDEIPIQPDDDLEEKNDKLKDPKVKEIKDDVKVSHSEELENKFIQPEKTEDSCTNISQPEERKEKEIKDQELEEKKDQIKELSETEEKEIDPIKIIEKINEIVKNEDVPNDSNEKEPEKESLPISREEKEVDKQEETDIINSYTNKDITKEKDLLKQQEKPEKLEKILNIRKTISKCAFTKLPRSNCHLKKLSIIKSSWKEHQQQPKQTPLIIKKCVFSPMYYKSNKTHYGLKSVEKIKRVFRNNKEVVKEEFVSVAEEIEEIENQSREIIPTKIPEVKTRPILKKFEDNTKLVKTPQVVKNKIKIQTNYRDTQHKAIVCSSRPFSQPFMAFKQVKSFESIQKVVLLQRKLRKYISKKPKQNTIKTKPLLERQNLVFSEVSNVQIEPEVAINDEKVFKSNHITKKILSSKNLFTKDHLSKVSLKKVVSIQNHYRNHSDKEIMNYSKQAAILNPVSISKQVISMESLLKTILIQKRWKSVHKKNKTKDESSNSNKLIQTPVKIPKNFNNLLFTKRIVQKKNKNIKKISFLQKIFRSYFKNLQKNIIKIANNYPLRNDYFTKFMKSPILDNRITKIQNNTKNYLSKVYMKNMKQRIIVNPQKLTKKIVSFEDVFKIVLLQNRFRKFVLNMRKEKVQNCVNEDTTVHTVPTVPTVLTSVDEVKPTIKEKTELDQKAPIVLQIARLPYKPSAMFITKKNISLPNSKVEIISKFLKSKVSRPKVIQYGQKIANLILSRPIIFNKCQFTKAYPNANLFSKKVAVINKQVKVHFKAKHEAKQNERIISKSINIHRGAYYSKDNSSLYHMKNIFMINRKIKNILRRKQEKEESLKTTQEDQNSKNIRLYKIAEEEIVKPAIKKALIRLNATFTKQNKTRLLEKSLDKINCSIKPKITWKKETADNLKRKPIMSKSAKLIKLQKPNEIKTIFYLQKKIKSYLHKPKNAKTKDVEKSFEEIEEEVIKFTKSTPEIEDVVNIIEVTKSSIQTENMDAVSKDVESTRVIKKPILDDCLIFKQQNINLPEKEIIKIQSNFRKFKNSKKDSFYHSCHYDEKEEEYQKLSDIYDENDDVINVIYILN